MKTLNYLLLVIIVVCSSQCQIKSTSLVRYGILNDTIRYEKKTTKGEKYYIKLEKYSLVKILEQNNDNVLIKFNIQSAILSEFEGDAPALTIERDSTFIKKGLIDLIDPNEIPGKYYDNILGTIYSDKELPSTIKRINYDAKNELIIINYMLGDLFEAIFFTSIYKIKNGKPVLEMAKNCDNCENEILEVYKNKK